MVWGDGVCALCVMGGVEELLLVKMVWMVLMLCGYVFLYLKLAIYKYIILMLPPFLSPLSPVVSYPSSRSLTRVTPLCFPSPLLPARYLVACARSPPDDTM